MDSSNLLRLISLNYISKTFEFYQYSWIKSNDDYNLIVVLPHFYLKNQDVLDEEFNQFLT